MEDFANRAGGKFAESLRMDNVNGGIGYTAGANSIGLYRNTYITIVSLFHLGHAARAFPVFRGE